MEDLDQLFKRIDNLETFVGVMKKQVDEMESRVDQAERDLEIGISSSLKRVFTSFLPKRPIQAPTPAPVYRPYLPLDTSRYFEN